MLCGLLAAVLVAQTGADKVFYGKRTVHPKVSTCLRGSCSRLWRSSGRYDRGSSARVTGGRHRAPSAVRRIATAGIASPARRCPPPTFAPTPSHPRVNRRRRAASRLLWLW